MDGRTVRLDKSNVLDGVNTPRPGAGLFEERPILRSMRLDMRLDKKRWCSARDKADPGDWGLHLEKNILAPLIARITLSRYVRTEFLRLQNVHETYLLLHDLSQNERKKTTPL